MIEFFKNETCHKFIMLHIKDGGLSITKQLSINALSFPENICSSNCTVQTATATFFGGGFSPSNV